MRRKTKKNKKIKKRKRTKKKKKKFVCKFLYLYFLNFIEMFIQIHDESMFCSSFRIYY